MKAKKYFLIISALLIVAACRTTKKVSKSTAPVTANPIATTPVTAADQESGSSNLSLPSKSIDGIYAPGNEELAAIQLQYKDVTLEKLKEGHEIYTVGACIKCHGVMNIYKRTEVQWKGIIDDMAQKAEISDAQKDAVYKYVLSIKAMQSK